MKSQITINFTTIFVALLLSLMFSLAWAESLDIRNPEKWFDENSRFWVYKDGIIPEENDLDPVPPYGIPYLPYAWMSDSPDKLSEMIKMNLKHKQNPHKGNMCIAVSIKWLEANWCGVGFVSGPDKDKEGAPWWGKTNHGWYYDLSKLKKKKFVFHLRGENGGERVQWKIGFLGNEKYGDSLPFPAETKWLKLNKEWTRYELDLSKKKLERVCSLCFVVERLWQTDREAPVNFYIDTAYFE